MTDPTFTLHLYEPCVEAPVWRGSLRTVCDRELAGCTAPDWRAVVDMLVAVLEREIPEVYE